MRPLKPQKDMDSLESCLGILLALPTVPPKLCFGLALQLPETARGPIRLRSNSQNPEASKLKKKKKEQILPHKMFNFLYNLRGEKGTDL